ncbi:MAG: PadR family transcriptional regulator [Gemmatimonadota bacterium]|nr:PadR family transcriptional regulator [Gemmatimonadota bacterium]
MSRDKSDVLLGTLDLLVLKLLEHGPMHGWGLAVQLESVTDGVFQVNQGSLYPALQRLQRKGKVRSRWGTSENARRARYYELTGSGVEQLATEIENWARTSGAVNRVIAFEGGAT